MTTEVCTRAENTQREEISITSLWLILLGTGTSMISLIYLPYFTVLGAVDVEQVTLVEEELELKHQEEER